MDGSINENTPPKRKRGRPSKTDLYGGHIRAAENLIADHLADFIHNLVRLANGVWVEEMTKEGVRLVYQQAPDRASNEYLLNRIMGKPTEIQEVSGPDGEPLGSVVKVYVPDNGRNRLNGDSAVILEPANGREGGNGLDESRQ
jgi:hypothetical protein